MTRETTMPVTKRTLPLSAAAALLAGAASALVTVCGPFTDTANDSFCPFVLELFTLGITTGTTPTTYSPADNVTRLQMAAFLSRTADAALKRGSRRAALKKFWTTQGDTGLGLTTVGNSPIDVASDGLDVWVSQSDGVARVRASDGRVLETWTGALNGRGILSAMGKILVAGLSDPGTLYRIDPAQPAGGVTTVASNLGVKPLGIAFDGSRVWTANVGTGANTGSVSIATPGAAIPWTVTTVSAGFSQPRGALYDGANAWVTDSDLGQLLKLDSAGAILQTVTVGGFPLFAVFDGTNIWVPNNSSDSISVVRASTGTVLSTLTANGLSFPSAAAFDGQRILVTNNGNNSVSLWKAADLTAGGSFTTGAGTFPSGACSDRIHFWIALFSSDQLARF